MRLEEIYEIAQINNYDAFVKEMEERVENLKLVQSLENQHKTNLNPPAVGTKCLVKTYDNIRVATFLGYGKTWGSMDWKGDTGFSSDVWQHKDVENYIPLDEINI